MANHDDRVLSFFVSGALLAGAAACSKTKKDDEQTSNSGPVPIEKIDAGVADTNELPTKHVNEGQMPGPSDAGPKKVNTGPAKVPSPTNP
jgi:hypothetical protein